MPSIIDITMAYRPERKPPGARTTAILLAAGQSTRMGAHNKLLLDVGGQPMVRRVAETCSPAASIRSLPCWAMSTRP